jgi:hypothetical protein
MIRTCLLTAFVVLSASGEVCAAQTSDPGYVSSQKIDKALRTLDEYYSDVKAKINCHRDRYVVAKIICRNKYLYDLATLNSKAHAYAMENAAGSLIDHKKGYGGIPPLTCLTKKCIYAFYKSEINASLGDISPFSEADEDGGKPAP